MSEMNFSHLLPFYLDETDEQVVALNDALLKLEQDQTDAAALAVAFRIVHTIKGSSAALGFTEVNKLTHHLESFFDMLRSGKRQLDGASLDLFFKCLDELRNYHQRLRETGRAEVDFSDLINQVILQIRKVQQGTTAEKEPGPKTPQPDPRQAHPLHTTIHDVEHLFQTPSDPNQTVTQEPVYTVEIRFQDDLTMPDMKARLVAKRLSALGEILASDPPTAQLDEITDLTGITFRVATESSVNEIRKAVDMSGIVSINILKLGPQNARGISREIVKEIRSVAGSGSGQTIPQETLTKIDLNRSPIALDRDPEQITQQSGAAAESVDQPACDEQLAGTAVVAPKQPETTAKPAEKSPSKSVGKVGETVRVELERLDHLMNLTGELVLSKSRFVQVSSALNEKLGQSSRRLQPSDSLDRVESLKSSLAAVNSGQVPLESVSQRMQDELRRLTEEIEVMSRELTRARQARASLDDLGEAVHQLTRVCDGLQKGVLDTRMIPIGPLFERFRRVIRDLSHATGKEIKLKITGESTELDKRVIDELADPLVHMVRNAGDHGLETPDERERANKPRAGTISLAAAHSGDRVTITVSDDGRGINVERIRKKIVEKGLVDATAASRLSDRDLIQYIWHPGLSTAEAVTDISGRGVGMDIVKNHIESLNGTIDIRSTPGQGTTFVIRLPLTLAILPSLLVRVHEEVYAIALDHIREIVEVRPAHMHQIRNRRVIEIRERIVPVISLDDLFLWGNKPYPAKAQENAKADDNGGTTRIVILHSADEMVGLVVNQLMGLQEVVLKSLEKNLGPVEGLSGASILGDGRVSLILDVDRLIDKAALGISTRSGVA